MNKLIVTTLILGLSFNSLHFADAQTKKSKKTAQKTVQKKVVKSASATSKKQTVGELLRRVKEDSRGAKIQAIQKGKIAIPESQFNFQQKQSVNLGSVKPPRSTEIFKNERTADQLNYEKTLDLQIQELFKLTKKFDNNQNRGELWLRLAELYLEKATLVDSRKQDQYDEQLKKFQAGKTKSQPKLDQRETQDYHNKAVQLYEWFVRDYPKDPKMSQALFFLGYNYFEMGQFDKGIKSYKELTEKYPRSPYVGEAYFALGEHYFESEKWVESYKNYSHLIKNKKHRLHTFSMYKGGWCLYRMGKTPEAIKYMDFIIRMGKDSDIAMGDGSSGTKRTVNRNRLESEALRDLVVFYAELGDTEKAINYFEALDVPDKKGYLEKLAYFLGEKGNREGSKNVFKHLIDADPMNKKAFDYQYQIVQNYFYSKNSPQFKEELYRWINDYKKDSAWSAQNADDKAFLDNVYKLREQTLRNYILQQHQTAQNSRAKYSQQTALGGYQLYFQEFSDAASASDMKFYYGELLYDMGKFEDAAAQYAWVAENAPQSKFAGKASENLLLSIGKAIPKDEDLEKRVGDSLEPIPMDPRVEKFIKAATWYTQKYPNSEKDAEIRFRVGRLYYQTNNFGPAEKYFKEIVKKHPKTKFSEYSANLLLDMYNLKKDYEGLEKVGTELLADSSIAGSKAGADIRGVLEKANFKKAQDLEGEKRFQESAEQFQIFATQNPKSELVAMALFNAGVNFERAGRPNDAVANYKKVISSKDKNAENLKYKSKKLLAKIYQDSGKNEEAASLFKQLAAENPKDPLAPNFLFNSAIMFESIGKTKEAIQGYLAYTEVNKNQKENAEITFKVAEMYRKSGSKSLALKQYKDHAELSRNNSKKVESYYWIYQMTKSQEARDKAIETYNRLYKEDKEMSAKFVADFKYSDAEKIYKELRSISIPADPAKQKKAVDKKLELVNQLNNELASVIKLNTANEIVKSLNLLGQTNEHMAQSILNAPLPAGLNEDQKKQYMAGIQKIADPFVAKSDESYKAAIERGIELETYNQGYLNALEKMHAKSPLVYPLGQEQAVETKMLNWSGE